MIHKFKKHIQKEFPYLKNTKLLVTVSGGIDSVMLTHLVQQLDYKISIAHCNFRLRGKDADLDEQFVKQLANTINIPYHVTHFDTKKHAKQQKTSIQEAARNLRYKWFEEIREKNNLDYILTAHNLNDNLETFLINLTRGTGLKGLTGIATVNGKIARPLLAFSRKEIITFAKEGKYKWREDKSNADTKYTRNKIRHKVIPVLQELNPNLLKTFKNTLENLQGSEAIVKDRISQIFEERQDARDKTQETRDKTQETRDKTQETRQFSIQQLKEIPNLKAYIYEIFAPYHFTNFEDIITLLSAQSGKQLYSKTHRLIKDREYLLLVAVKKEKQEVRSKKEEARDKTQEVRSKTQEVRSKKEDIQGKIQKGETKFNLQNLELNLYYKKANKHEVTSKNKAQFDKDLLKFPLTVRKWQKGDYFYPIGMQGKKKLSKYFKDEKLSLIEKENIWLLLSEEKIVWIIGKRQDERFKITETTKQTLQITIK